MTGSESARWLRGGLAVTRPVVVAKLSNPIDYLAEAAQDSFHVLGCRSRGTSILGLKSQHLASLPDQLGEADTGAERHSTLLKYRLANGLK